MAYNVRVKNNLQDLNAKMAKIPAKSFKFNGKLVLPEIEFTEAIGAFPMDEMRQYTMAEVSQALAKAKGEIADALNAAMSSSAWQWRTGGSRDIVDTGALKSSLSITFSGGSFQISYSEPYAALVHWGGYIYPYGNKGAERIYLPGRPWVEATVMGGGPVPQIQWDNLISKYL